MSLYYDNIGWFVAGDGEFLHFGADQFMLLVATCLD
jgi:hypothetical protein